jgi:hypothetical protein
MTVFLPLAHGLVEGILHRSDGVDWLHSFDAKCQ